MSEQDPYKHIRALAQSITHRELPIGPEEPGGAPVRTTRQQRKNDIELGTMAETLRTARLRKGLTQRELGQLAGVPQSHISKIEAGGVDLRLSSLVALAQVLDLSLNLAPAPLVLAPVSGVESASGVRITPGTTLPRHELTADPFHAPAATMAQ